MHHERISQKLLAPSGFDYAALVEQARVHGSVYTEPEIFDEEMRVIWHDGWVYVGHESEVPTAGDRVLKQIGREPVIMSRNDDGCVYILLNRCSHRANKVCEVEREHSARIRCPYHGWTFSSSGELLAVPYGNGYAADFDRANLNLARVPRVESYRGFIFGSLAPDGISLREHLGNAAEALDRLSDLSPDGEIELGHGWMKHRYKANWKLVVENQVDGYHLHFTHQSFFKSYSTAEKPYKDGVDYAEGGSLVRVVDLLDGHSELDYRAEYRRTQRGYQWFGGIEDAKIAGYAAAMQARYGAETAWKRVVDGPPHTMIFPNLFLAELNIATIQPISVGMSSLHTTPVFLKGAPEINTRVIRRCEAAMGPAGALLADDAEMSERNQRGLAAGSPEWITLARGLERESTTEDGLACSNVTDETPQRAIWRHYRSVMSAAC
jgi:phenylpropionate dioxygenase-like ring-hydroxylating dioxygenase large terminal subunit